MTSVGKPIKAAEFLRLIKGEGTYIDDIRKDSPLFLKVIRSPYAHARIKDIDFSAVSDKSLLLVTSKLVSDKFSGAMLPALQIPQAKNVKMPTLATDKVNFVGQPVAAVVARDRYEAEDLLELVSVDYDPLGPIVDPDQAMSPNSSVIHESIGTNIGLDTKLSGGDIHSAFSSADIVVEDTLRCHRISPNPIETRGIIAQWDGTAFNVWVSCQGVFQLRQSLREALGVSDNQLRVYQPDVGGAFGAKSPAYPEYVLACYASMALQRPIKWIETRSEHLIATYHGRSASAQISLAAKRDGTILGIKGTVIADLGAYSYVINPRYSSFIAQQLTGPYRTPAAEFRVLNVFTNKVPTGPYRGAGRPEAAFFYERMMDLLSDELKIDPLEIRARNLVRISEMPYKTPLGLNLDPEDYHLILSKAGSIFDYPKLRYDIEKERRNGKSVGLGLSTYIEQNNTMFGESATARLREGGIIEVATGLGPHGQGHQTILSQLVSDEFGIEPDKVLITFGSTESLARGVGTYGSRSAVIGGAAAIQASRELKLKMLQECSKLVNIPQSDLKIEGGIIVTASGRTIQTLSELAEKNPNLESAAFAEGTNIISFGVHIVKAEVDRETGKAVISKYMALDDAGRVINPLLTEPQVVGGVMQALGEVLYEEIVYAADGQPLVGSIGDAGVPTAVEGIDVQSVLFEYPSKYPHGARGVGEAGSIGGLPAIVSAIDKAMGQRMNSTMAKPENLFEIMQRSNLKTG